jgi:hypothetical protein
VDVIMMRIINMIAEVSKHPDDYIRYLLTSEPGLFIMGPAGALAKANMPGVTLDKGKNGAAPKTVGICPDWFYTGNCRHKESASGCVHQHPLKAKNAAKSVADPREEALKKKQREREQRDRDKKQQDGKGDQPKNDK